ncbi:hypothetical protein [Paraclostridium bifermentans]|uniref:hypothetical protein n=1 Tax=Paraclostridium bifermentans TaxID=1490 RepID=UPI001FF31C38|nr:hypothetical protein [Paraclostridium bifermentans]UOW66851.1 hypothetical protein MTR78_09840 [Paraclostridium bifermentans]
MNNSMTLEEAIDFLAKNCPHVFAPIANEMQSLRSENTDLKDQVVSTQEIVNELVMQSMSQNI